MVREQSSTLTQDSSLRPSELNNSSHLLYCLSLMVVFQVFITLGELVYCLSSRSVLP